MPNITFDFFENLKNQLSWSPVLEWLKGVGFVQHFAWKGYRTDPGRGGVPLFFLYINANNHTGDASASLYANVMRDPHGRGQKILDQISLGQNPDAEHVSLIMRDRYGIPTNQSMGLINDFLVVHLPNYPQTKDIDVTSDKATSHYRLFNYEQSLMAVIYITTLSFYSKVTGQIEKLYQPRAHVFNTKTNKLTPTSYVGEMYTALPKANSEFYKVINVYKDSGFEEHEKILNKMTEKDFARAIEQANSDINKNIQEMAEVEGTEDLYELYLKNKQDSTQAQNNHDRVKTSQSNTSSWYSGNIPDPDAIERFIGTPSVDASQIKTVFVGVDDAINFVNRFDSSLLQNVGYIFNFSHQGAYGVYLPALDDQIKRAKIKSILKNEGCTIEENADGSFYAFHPDKSSEEIQQEIDRHYNLLTSRGGAVFGINMNKVMSTARSNASDIGATTNEDLQDLVLMHLGATIVHEAVHAKNSHTEGPSEAAEMNFLQWVLPIINEKRLQRYKAMGLEQDFAPLEISRTVRTSQNSSWLKHAYAVPPAGYFNANANAFLLDKWKQMGMGLAFAKPGIFELMLQNAWVPTEDSKRHMILEKKIREKDAPFVIDKDFPHIEDMLQKDRDLYGQYGLTESLLNDKRVAPLTSVDTMKQNHSDNNSSMTKTATMFGWYNNLDLPMRERVIPVEDAPEFQVFDWQEIRALPRYNSDGESYIYCEPRQNSPELWERMIANRPSSFISPARRFASRQISQTASEKLLESTIHTDNDLTKIVKMLDITGYCLDNKYFLGNRVLVSEDLIDNLKRFFKNNVNIAIYIDRDNPKHIKDDVVFPGWIYRSSVPTSVMQLAEDYICQRNTTDGVKKLYEYIVGISDSYKTVIVKSIVNGAQGLCQSLGIQDVFIVGGYPRAIVMETGCNDVHDLDFASAWPSQCVKLGGMLADELGVVNTEFFHRTMTLSWEWMGLKCDFKGNFTPVDVRNLLRKHNIKTTPLNLDVYARDFTINMLVYSVLDGKIYDVCGQSVSDIKNKILNIYFEEDSSEIVKQNPMIVLRALKYMIRYSFDVSEILHNAIMENKELLFKTYSSERLLQGLKELFAEDYCKAKKMIKEYGLEKLYSFVNEIKEEDV